MQDLIADLFTNSSFGIWDVLLAAVVLVAGWLVSTWCRRGVVRALARWTGLAPGATNLVARSVRYSILLLTVGIVLTVLGAPLQPVLAAVIIVAAVAFLALRGVAANFGAGVVIQVRHPIHIGDHVEVDGVEGDITELTGRAVLLRTADGWTVRVPNSLVLEVPLRNASETGAVRSEVTVRLRMPLDLGPVRDAVQRVVEEHHGPHDEVADTLVQTVTPTWADLRVRFWSTYAAREHTRSSVVRAVAAALDAQRIAAIVSVDPLPVYPATTIYAAPEQRDDTAP